jgi:hypothetical protein
MADGALLTLQDHPPSAGVEAGRDVADDGVEAARPGMQLPRTTDMSNLHHYFILLFIDIFHI